MVVGESYKKIAMQIGGSCYLLSRKKWTDKMTDEAQGSITDLAAPQGKGQRWPPLLKEEHG